jgi:nucleolar protein 56
VVCRRSLIALAEYRRNLSDYMSSKMSQVAPNLGALIGEPVAARLISHAGSLTNLAKVRFGRLLGSQSLSLSVSVSLSQCPASTVQILGAEKALFRALKTKGNTPKYGLIFHSSFIGRAGAKNKGRISRCVLALCAWPRQCTSCLSCDSYLANKCSIAARMDAFSDSVTAVYGEALRDQVEERLKFFESGETPRKNADVMAAVGDKVRAATTASEDGEGKKKSKKDKKDKKDKKRQLEEEAEVCWGSS